jgi:prepilin-type N-terminal cleavage/methylation domain-containing protein
VIEALNKKRGEEGFTLIELLIVIVILGILAAIVVFAVGTTGSNAAASACKADAKSVEVALEAYKAQNPTNPNGFPPGPTSPSDTITGSQGWGALLNVGSGAGAPFLRQVPSTSHYLLWWNSTGSVFVASSGAAYPATPVGGTGTDNMNFDQNSAACNTYAH